MCVCIGGVIYVYLSHTCFGQCMKVLFLTPAILLLQHDTTPQFAKTDIHLVF